MLTRLLIYPISFLASVLIARYLGPEDRGVAAFLTLVVAFLMPVISLGIGAGVRYQISSKKYSPSEVFSSCIFIALVFGSLGATSIYASWEFEIFGETGELVSRLQILLVSSAFIFQSVYFFLTRLLAADSKFPLLNSFELFKGMLHPILLVTMVWLYAMKVDGVAGAILILYGLLALLAVTSCIRLYGLGGGVDGSFILHCFSYGIRSWIGDIAVKANARLDQLILAATIAPFGLGIYSIAVVLAELIWIIPDSIGPVLFNKIAAMTKGGDRTAMTARMLRLLLLPSVIAAFALWFSTKYILIPYGYGTEYSDVVSPLTFLLVGSVVFIPAKIITKIFSGSGQVIYSSYATAMGSVISVILYFYLIPTHGLLGAAIASAIGYAAISVICLLIYRTHYDSSIGSMFIVQWQDLLWLRKLIMGLKFN